MNFQDNLQHAGPLPAAQAFTDEYFAEVQALYANGAFGAAWRALQLRAGEGRDNVHWWMHALRLGAALGDSDRALAAADALQALQPDAGVVLSADTLVAVDGKALGKPHSEKEAFQMLSLLSGRWHQVYTGVCAVDAQGMVHQRVVGTQVHFCPMTEEEIRRYIATGEPMDKAGAYAVQGIAGLWIDKLEGSYSNVIGLPMHTVRELLDECGLHCWRA